MIRTLAVAGYRSIAGLVVGLDRLTVVTGPNGSGKTNLYRSLALLADAARGGVVPALAREGGLASTLWAGPREAVDGRPGPALLRLGFGSDDFGYALDLGVPRAGTSMFTLDPEVRREVLWHGPILRPAATLVDRTNTVVRVRDGGDWQMLPQQVPLRDCLLAELSDPQHAPEVFAVRRRVASWRFYDQVRTDADSPARRPAVATRTTAVAADGHDLAPAVQTILEEGSAAAPLHEALDQAFGAEAEVLDVGGRMELRLHLRGLMRPLSAGELSDGTLRFVVWAAALLSPAPPQLLVLNEPETSLHPSLIAPLAGLVAAAVQRTQVVVVTHSDALVAALDERMRGTGLGVNEIRLAKRGGRTTVDGVGLLEGPPWTWPKR
ncbi:MAG: AAA family ATPase [Kineosporiaceae bacterium]